MGPDILVPLAGCAMIAAIVIVPRYFKSKERQQLQETIRAAIQNGQPLPPDVIEAMTRDVKPAASPTRDLRVGIIWLALAAALGVIGVLNLMNDESDGATIAWCFAAIPGFIGLAFVALGLMSKKKS